jgi:hypothetical protein
MREINEEASVWSRACPITNSSELSLNFLDGLAIIFGNESDSGQGHVLAGKPAQNFHYGLNYLGGHYWIQR